MKKLKLIFIFLLFSHQINSHLATPQEMMEYAKEHLLNKKKHIKALFFLPNQEVDVKKILLGLIHNEKKSIHLAQFIINDKDIANALCQAHQRGVNITGIADGGSLAYSNSKIMQLMQAGINLILYKKPYSIMHLKCFLFGKNLFNREILWLGSANTTFSAYKKNQEYVHISQNKLFIQQFKDNFSKLYREISTAQKEMPKTNNIIINQIWHLGKLNIFLHKNWIKFIKK